MKTRYCFVQNIHIDFLVLHVKLRSRLSGGFLDCKESPSNAKQKGFIKLIRENCSFRLSDDMIVLGEENHVLFHWAIVLSDNLKVVGEYGSINPF